MIVCPCRSVAVCVPDVALPRAQDIVAAMPLTQGAADDEAAVDEDNLREGDAGWLPA